MIYSVLPGNIEQLNGFGITYHKGITFSNLVSLTSYPIYELASTSPNSTIHRIFISFTSIWTNKFHMWKTESLILSTIVHNRQNDSVVFRLFIKKKSNLHAARIKKMALTVELTLTRFKEHQDSEFVKKAVALRKHAPNVQRCSQNREVITVSYQMRRLTQTLVLSSLSLRQRGDRSKWPRTGSDLYATNFSKLAIGLPRWADLDMMFWGATQSISRQISK